MVIVVSTMDSLLATLIFVWRWGSKTSNHQASSRWVKASRSSDLKIQGQENAWSALSAATDLPSPIRALIISGHDSCMLVYPSWLSYG